MHACAGSDSQAPAGEGGQANMKAVESSVIPMNTANANEQTNHSREANRQARNQGVDQDIYLNYITSEMDKEQACLELPFTIALLSAFAFLALTYLGQSDTMLFERAVIFDIVENANFAWAQNFGHKGIYDVNSYADFWSWVRLGLVPLLTSPWTYSEDLAFAVPSAGNGTPAYNVSALPSRRDFRGYRRKIPVKNDYLQYNRIIGGWRFRQTVADVSMNNCRFPGDVNSFRRWFGKPCANPDSDELSPDLLRGEKLDNSTHEEVFVREVFPVEALILKVMDMEDGCSAADAQNRTCLCNACASWHPRMPWLNELTSRVEISFVIFNAQYGLYGNCMVHFFFNRAGHVHKIINVRSAWAGVGIRKTKHMVMMFLSGTLWASLSIYMVIIEGWEFLVLIKQNPKQVWYITLMNEYIGFWNTVDWISILIACVCICFFALLSTATNSVNVSLAEQAVLSASGPSSNEEYMEKVKEFYRLVETMGDYDSYFRFALAAYPLVLMLRLMKSFAAQPKLAIVTETFVFAKNDMVHFFIVFFSVYLCMTINAVLFFGQDSVDFTTLGRALHACFRALLGDWDWDEIESIGLGKTFVWFFLFMIIVVLILYNMLIAIILESYGEVKQQAQGATSLGRQVRELIRRWQMNRRGERVRLKDIYHAFLTQEEPEQAGRKIFPPMLQEIVPGIPKDQALRTLMAAQNQHELKIAPPFVLDHLKADLDRAASRFEDITMSCMWLNTCCESYVQADEEELARQEAQRNWQAPEGLDAVRFVATSRATELSEGVSAVLDEEVRGLERRQKEQQRAMEQTQAALQGLRSLVYKLKQTCGEVAQLAVDMAPTVEAIPTVKANALPSVPQMQAPASSALQSAAAGNAARNGDGMRRRADFNGG